MADATQKIRTAAGRTGAECLWVAAAPPLDKCRRRQHLDARTHLCRKVLQVAGDQRRAGLDGHFPKGLIGEVGQRGRQWPCYQG